MLLVCGAGLHLVVDGAGCLSDLLDLQEVIYPAGGPIACSKSQGVVTFLTITIISIIMSSSGEILRNRHVA